MARKKKQRRDNHLNDRADQTQKLLAETLRMQARTLALLEHGERRRKRSRSHNRVDDATQPRAGVARRRVVLTPRRRVWPATESSASLQHSFPIPTRLSVLPIPPPPHELPIPPPPRTPPRCGPAVQETDKAKQRARLSARQGAGKVEESGAAYLHYMDECFVRLMAETLSTMRQQGCEHMSV
jgi:hypothetical protein